MVLQQALYQHETDLSRSELAFRTIARKYGAELAYTPMLHSRLFAEAPKYRAECFTTNSGDRPVVAQFCANNPDTLVAAAEHVQAHVDAIDLNLGCPQGIAKRGRYGAFLQDDWALLRRIVGAAATQLDVPVWCKIRVFADTDRTVAYARMLQDAGASVIAVHGRTREQKGKNVPPADWDIIRAVKQALHIPVIANGNVRTRRDAENAIAYTGADAVMAAWALLDNPAVFAGSKAPSRLALAREYLEIAERLDTPLKMVRMHIFKMFRSRLDVNMDLNETVAKCRSFEMFHQVADCLEQRTDYGGFSFEERLLRGDVVVNEVCPRKKRKTKAGVEQKQNAAADTSAG